MSLIEFFSDTESFLVFMAGVIVSSIFIIGVTYQLYGKNTVNKKKSK